MAARAVEETVAEATGEVPRVEAKAEETAEETAEASEGSQAAGAVSRHMRNHPRSCHCSRLEWNGPWVDGRLDSSQTLY